MFSNFWSKKGLLNYLLLPISLLYYLAFKIRFNLTPQRKINAKVICVGNIVVGGGGKTPVVQEIAKRNKKCAIVLRGYKGKLSKRNKPVKVDLEEHSARDVGEEALLHAKVAPTYICANRYLAAKLAEENGAKTIILDDGLQNNTLYKDEIFLVFDHDFWIGNGMLFPSGPLREKLDNISYNVNKIFIIKYSGSSRKLKIDNADYINAELEDYKKFQKSEAIIFCGLANPNKFISSLRKYKVKIKKKFLYPDHHFFTKNEIEKAVKYSEKYKYKILTTSKDYVKIPKEFQKYFIEVKLKISLP